MIPPASPRRWVGCREECLHFAPGQVANQLFILTLAWNGQHPCGNAEAVRVTEGNQAEKRANCRQTDIAGADSVAALLFEVVEKAEHGGGIEIGNP